MDVQECIKTRRSVRKYEDKPIEWDKIIQILDSGRFAPSAGNLQNLKFIVVRKEALIKKLSQAAPEQQWIEKAPVHIVVVAESEKGARFYGIRGERFYAIQNCAAAIQNMLLTANALGLGGCWVGAFDENKVKKALDITPVSAIPQAIITLGYADEKPDAPPRKGLETYVFLDKWLNRGQGYRARGYKSIAIKDAIDNTKNALKRIVKNLVKDEK